MKLEAFRKEIDTIDDNILELLERRMEIVKHIGKLKAQSNTPIYRPEREQKIIQRLLAKTTDPLKYILIYINIIYI